MNSFAIAFNAVLPVLTYAVLGVFLRKKQLLKPDALKQINTVCFRFFLTSNLLYSILTANLKEIFDARFFLTGLLINLAVLVISLITAVLFEKDNIRRGALAHGLFHTNFLIYGTALATSIYGEGNIAPISLMVAMIVPFQNLVSVIILEYFRGNKEHSSVKDHLLPVIKNPYVITAVLGFALKLTGITFPAILLNIFRDLGRCGTPLALIAMGGLLNFDSIRSNTRPILLTCIFRLVLIPAIFIPFSVFLGLRGVQLAGIACNVFAPCAASCYTLAAAMDSDTDLTSQMILFTSLFSMITIFLWIWGLSSLALI